MATDSTPFQSPFTPLTIDEYKQVVETFAQAIWETDANGQVVTDSPSWRAYTGQSLEEWLGEGWVAVVHPDDQAYALHQWQEAVRHQTPVNAEFRLRSPEGGWRWTNMRATRMLAADGSVRKWVGLNIDIDERKKAQQLLQQQQTRLEEEVNRRTAQLQANQQLHQATLNSTLEMIQVFQAVRDEAGHLIDFVWVLNNQAAQQRFGDVIGQRLLAQDPEVVAMDIFDTFKQVVETGQSDQSERHYVHEQFDGWFYQSTVKLGDGVVTTTTDITPLKKAEAALRQSEAHLATIFQAAQVGISELDTQGRFLRVNDKLSQLLGRSPAELLGRNVTAVTYPADVATSRTRFNQVLQTGQSNSSDKRYQRADGELVWANCSLSLLPGAASEGDTVLAITVDLTQRRAAEEALRQSEDRYRTLVQNLPDYAIFRLNAEGVITEWTEGAQRVTGYRAQEAIGQHLALFYTPQEQAAGVPQQELAEAAHTGRTEREGWRIHKNGTWFLINEICTAIYDLSGQLAGFTKISRDITARKQAEDALLDSRQRLQIVMDSIAEHAIITLDPQGLITGWNTGAEAMFGYGVEQALGQSDALIFTPEDRAAGAPQAERQTARQQGRAPDERDHLRRDGSRFYVSGVLSPLYDGESGLLGYVKVARDLSQRRAMEQALREADRRKDEFLAMLAHELRNPMSTLRSGLTILDLTITDELTRSTVTMMNRQTEHLVRMVDDLLDVSRITQGKVELKKERVNLAGVVSQAAESVRSLYQEQGRRLQVDLPHGPIVVEGDATRLTQVVTNLLTNGARYTEEQGQVWLSLTQAGQEAILEVKDNGIGLAPDQVKAVFELFVQVDNSVARSKGGLGMGLTLVQRLVEMHGGRVEAQSEGLGQGSTFTVHLPTLTTAAEPKVEPTPQAKDPAAAKRILVIDDNADAGLMMAMLLKLKGYEAHTRTSGRAGIEAAESLRPAAILLDIGMPGMDGYETCRLIRAQAWGREMVVIALTGYGQEEDRQRTREAGFDGHLVKPVDLEVLLTMLRDLLDKNAKK